jgi:hypothetical protein
VDPGLDYLDPTESVAAAAGKGKGAGAGAGAGAGGGQVAARGGAGGAEGGGGKKDAEAAAEGREAREATRLRLQRRRRRRRAWWRLVVRTGGAAIDCAEEAEAEAAAAATRSAGASGFGLPLGFGFGFGSCERARRRVAVFSSVSGAFAASAGALGRDVAVFERAFAEVTASACLPSALRLVLGLGNAVNAGSFRGGAKGLTVASLGALTSVKSNDQRSGVKTLLHFLVKAADATHPGLLAGHTDGAGGGAAGAGGAGNGKGGDGKAAAAAAAKPALSAAAAGGGGQGGGGGGGGGGSVAAGGGQLAAELRSAAAAALEGLWSSLQPRLRELQGALSEVRVPAGAAAWVAEFGVPAPAWSRHQLVVTASSPLAEVT